jgi:predicted amidohydrolase
MKYDLLLEAGTLIDPSQKIHARKDLAFAAGRVARIGPLDPWDEVAERVDCSGSIVAAWNDRSARARFLGDQLPRH